jgi:hypothetical protein
MSYYSDASLVYIPAAVKNGKTYSVKPTDGTGDLTFSRASSATRVASNGLIEKVRENLQTYSQDFSNAVWNKSAGATLTHSETDPNGGTTASRLQMPSGVSNFFGTSFSGATNGGKYTHSIYMKSNTGSIQSVRLIDGVRGVAGGALTASVTASWQRFDVVITTASTSAGLQIDNAGGSYNNDILIAFAQTEESDFGATDYIATTTAAVSVGPVSGLPRLDYYDSTCPRLLLEPQRTNLLTFSEQIDNAAWTKFGSSASANQAVSPDGYTNGDKLLPNNGIAIAVPASGIFTAGAAAYVRSGALTLTAASYTFSIFVKKAELDHVQLRSGTSTDLTAGASGNIVNLNNGVSAVANTVQDYGNGWYRVSHTFTATAATWYVGVWFWNSTSLTTNGSQGILAYGAQLELGAYATSYIPTLSTSVTRVADAASKTGISSLIGQTEGTVFVEVDYANNGADQTFISTSDGTLNNRITIGYSLSLNVLNAFVRVGGITQALMTSATSPANGIKKIAVSYKLNDYLLYINGTQVAVDSSALVPTCSRLDVGSLLSPTGAEYPVNQALIFPTALTPAQLAELTTL